MNPTYLNNDILNNVFHEFVQTVYTVRTSEEKEIFLQRYPRYEFLSRRSLAGQAFENWLFAQGAGVRQINGLLHLEFVEESDATLFALRWS
jgi:hypothetical protein